MERESFKTTMLNPHERQSLRNWLYFDDWHFEVLFLEHCIEMSSFSIPRKGSYGVAKVYGLKAILTNSRRACVANIFIRYEYRVYRVHDIEQAVTFVKLLRKEADYEESRDRERKRRIEEKKKKKMATRELKAA
jgi:hypothetical protein